MMIIYKIQESGEATDRGYSNVCPDGFKSIQLDEKIRKIEDVDWDEIQGQKGLDSISLKDQNRTLINYLNLSEKHVSNDPPYPINVAEWKTARNEWRIQLKANELTDIYKKPY